MTLEGSRPESGHRRFVAVNLSRFGAMPPVRIGSARNLVFLRVFGTLDCGKEKMSLGSLAFRLRQKFGHGLRVAYWRDVVRPRILATRPITDGSDVTCEIHVMTSNSDWLNLLWGAEVVLLGLGPPLRAVHS